MARRRQRTGTKKTWPKQTIQICNWGCGLYSILDCSSLEISVFNPDADETETPNQLMPQHKTLPVFWLAWVEGANLLNNALEPEETP